MFISMWNRRTVSTEKENICWMEQTIRNTNYSMSFAG